MNTFDPTRPITLENWPPQLRMPPLKKRDQKPQPKQKQTSSFPFFD